MVSNNFVANYEKSNCNPSNVVKGNKFRFTILSDSLIRLEYSENGIFEDRPTELVWYRNIDKKSNYSLNDLGNKIEITTKYFRLTYVKEKPFKGTALNPTMNLKIELLNSDRVWFYGNKDATEARNYGAPGYSLDDSLKLKMRLGLYSPYGYSYIDDSDSLILNRDGSTLKRENNEIDLYVFMYLKDFAKCLTDYYDITGYPSLIPRYALGNWWSRDIAYTDKSLKELLDTFEQKKVPLSVVLLDRDWHIHNFNNKDLDTGFTWNNSNFNSPSSMIKYMHSKGIRVGLNVNPEEGFYPFEDNYLELKNYLNEENGHIPFNVYDNRVIEVYFKLIINKLDKYGVDFYWIDSNNKKSSKELWLLTHYHFASIKNDYARRAMILTRNPGIAAHRYPVLYSGKTIVSWDTLKLIPIHNNSATNIGVAFWSHDIGGYYKGVEDNELYTRFVQLGTFSPILKFGSDKGKYYKREPWKWNIKTYNIVNNYLTLRHRLIPYLYTESYKYHKYGIPLINPVYFKYPEMYDDDNYRNEYYFGSELFISPIIKKKDYVMNRVVHKFFLPDGIWYDFVTGKKFPGGKTHLSFFKDEDYPVFARAGSIIPFGDNDNLNDTTPPKNMEIQIFPGRSNTYNLYEDDGVSELYEKGFYLLSTIEYNYMPNNYTVIVRATDGKSGIVPDKRNYKFVFRNTKKANDVIVYFNDTKIESNNYVEGTNFIVEVNDVSTIGQLTLNCKGNDIEIDAVRIINEDIESIISDLQIETEMKEKIDSIFYSDLSIKKKRIEIRKLGNKGLEHKFIKLFLKLLDYINQVS